MRILRLFSWLSFIATLGSCQSTTVSDFTSQSTLTAPPSTISVDLDSHSAPTVVERFSTLPDGVSGDSSLESSGSGDSSAEFDTSGSGPADKLQVTSLSPPLVDDGAMPPSGDDATVTHVGTSAPANTRTAEKSIASRTQASDPAAWLPLILILSTGSLAGGIAVYWKTKRPSTVRIHPLQRYNSSNHDFMAASTVEPQTDVASQRNCGGR
eukprot:TRINITY_DN12022_c3_g7_i2.p1 TRINITY_DN12022_c3_g7~~TRINITY_DN12022_c3_g7_i2.p1  ORF type:complete len:211 (+),score=18.39 TRINITY_DN12022_c3_g7_i2:115-747(+)